MLLYLEAKQVLTISIKYTALTAGVVDEVLGCKVFGCSLPLGFGLRATAKNAVLAYELLDEGQEPPSALCDPTEVQLPDNVQLPIVPPLPSPLLPSPSPSIACSLTTRPCGTRRCSHSQACVRRHGVKATCTTRWASSCQRCSGCLNRTRPRCISRPRWRSCHGAPRR